MIVFGQILEIVALTKLASVLCTRNFSFIIIIIFKALKLAAAVFMYFFKFGRRRETSALRACFSIVGHYADMHIPGGGVLTYFHGCV